MQLQLASAATSEQDASVDNWATVTRKEMLRRERKDKENDAPNQVANLDRRCV